MKLGEVLRCWRKQHNLSIRDLATELGVSKGTLSRIERGMPMTGAVLARVLHWLTSPHLQKESGDVSQP